MTVAEQLIRAKSDLDEVYAAGKREGSADSVSAFMESYQDSGNRTDYATAFAGTGWNENTFKPTRDITPSNAYMMFRGCAAAVSLPEWLEYHCGGVKLDFSKATNTQYLFNNSSFTEIGVVDVSGSTGSTPLDNAFTQCKNLVKIEKIVLKTGANAEFSNTFTGCTSLESITFEGVIRKNGLNLQQCPLDAVTINSIAEHLEDKSGDTSGTEWVVTLGSRNLGMMAPGAEDLATQKGWVLK